MKLLKYILSYFKITSKRRFKKAIKNHINKHEIIFLNNLLISK